MPEWSCATCLDEQHEKGIAVPGGSKICLGCFRRLFELAIEDESMYPAHWGGIKLDYKIYYKHLGEELYNRYEAKMMEYETPLPQRVYCKQTDPPRRPDPCHNFIGPWNTRKECIRCEKCMWYTCLRCQETFSTGESSGERATISHECDPTKNSEVNSKALTGMQRGVDFQICPNVSCQRVWAIWDGCNHMKCTCKTYFCYICGIQTGREYSHFMNTSCPQYGFAGNNNRQPELAGMDALYGDTAGDGYAARAQEARERGGVAQADPRIDLADDFERAEFMAWRQHVVEAHEYINAALARGRWPNVQARWLDPRRYQDRRERFIVRIGSILWRAPPEGVPSDWQNPTRREFGFPEFPPRITGELWVNEQYAIYPVPRHALLRNGELVPSRMEIHLATIRPRIGAAVPEPQIVWRDPREVANEHRRRQRADQPHGPARAFWPPGRRPAEHPNIEYQGFWQDMWERLLGRQRRPARNPIEPQHIERPARLPDLIAPLPQQPAPARIRRHREDDRQRRG